MRKYVTKDQNGREVFDVLAYEDDMQMQELARIRDEKEKRKLTSQRIGLKGYVRRLFNHQKQ